MMSNDRRHSVAEEPYFITDPIERAEAEARNGILQFDAACGIISEALEAIKSGNRWRLRVSHIMAFHGIALKGISPHAGITRPSKVEISGSSHEPVPAHLVMNLLEELCDYVNENWEESSHIHLASYVMWRLNWIHPFSDGNGRTSRICSYLILCIKIGSLLPGKKTIPDQIVDNRKPYFDALEAADSSYKNGVIDVTEMEELLTGMLAAQLVAIVEIAAKKPLR